MTLSLHLQTAINAFMLTWRVLSRMLAIALYFAVCGAFGCALFLAGQAFVLVLLLGGANVFGITTATMNTFSGSFLVAICNLIIFLAGLGYLFGFASGAILFFVAGFTQGIQPVDNLPKAFRRTFHAAMRAGLCCGWAGALTGVAFVVVMNRQATPSSPNAFVGFTYGLAAGNFLGIAIGAFSPGTVERARQRIKSSFSSIRRA